MGFSSVALKSVPWRFAEFYYKRGLQKPYTGTYTILQERINEFLCLFIICLERRTDQSNFERRDQWNGMDFRTTRDTFLKLCDFLQILIVNTSNSKSLRIELALLSWKPFSQSGVRRKWHKLTENVNI